MDGALPTAVAGAVLGLLAGALLQRTHYCFMGAVSDWALFGGLRRLRAWMLAAGLGVLGTHALFLFTGLPREDVPHLSGPVFWLGPVAGGLVFGFGMVLAGGCPSRDLVRAASGSARALLAVLLVAVSAGATMAGVLAPLYGWLRAVGTLPTEVPASLPDLLAAAGLPQAGVVVPLVAGGALVAAALADPALRRPGPELAAGLGLGLLVVAGYAVTGLLLYDPFEPRPVVSLAYVGPSARTLWWLAVEGGLPSFGAALVLGTLAGAFLSARARGELRFEGFADRADALRHATGGILMGLGGTLAMGCTVGQGLSGLSTLSLASLLAVAAIVAGARLALAWLAAGSPLPRLFSTSSHTPARTGGPRP